MGQEWNIMDHMGKPLEHIGKQQNNDTNLVYVFSNKSSAPFRISSCHSRGSGHLWTSLNVSFSLPGPGFFVSHVV